jgi:hypothetical protein
MNVGSVPVLDGFRPFFFFPFLFSSLFYWISAFLSLLNSFYYFFLALTKSFFRS